MADKEVQDSKKLTVSAAITGKKATPSSSKSSDKQPSSSHAKEQGKSDLNKDPTIREMLEILQTMNKNVVSHSARMDKQDKRLDDMLAHISETSKYLSYEGDEYDDNMDFESNVDQFSVSEQYDGESLEEQAELPSQPKSIYKVLSDKFNQTETLDKSVHPDLANLVNSSFRQGLSEDKYEELVKEIHRPENCASLVKTRVNQGIWRLLKSWTQADDAKWSSIQGILVKATSSIVKLLDKLGSSDSEHLELGTTTVALLGHAYKTINVKRKELHKSDLDSKYHYLASASLPYTDLLYGDDNDVNNNVREINTMNRIGRTVGQGGGPMRGAFRGRRGRGAPYNPRGPRGRGRYQPYQSYHSSSRTETMTAPKNQKPQKKQ